MKIHIAKISLLGDGTPDFSSFTDIVGKIRIWVMGSTSPSNYWILLEDDGLPLSIDTKMDLTDFNLEFNPRIEEIFTKSKVKLQDYSKGLKRGFHMDIWIPLSLALKYQSRIP